MNEQNFIENELVILSKNTIDLFLKQKNPTDCIALYIFYYYTAKWQKTNQIKCATTYAAKGLKKSREWVIKTKKILMELGLVDDIKVRGANGKITGWYIKINYVWKGKTVKEKSHYLENPEGGDHHGVESADTNALSANSLNALSANKIKDFSPEFNEYRKTVINWFNKNYENFHNGKKILWKGKEIGKLNELLKLDKNELIYKFNMLCSLYELGESYYDVFPSKLLSVWNDLNDELLLSKQNKLRKIK